MDSKFEKIYDTYYDSVYRYIFVSVKDKWNAEDIISNVFIKVYENIEKLRSVEESKNWIFRVAHNCIIDFYRKKGKVIPIDEFIGEGKEEKGFDNIIIQEEFNEVKEILKSFPERTRNMIYLRFYSGLKFKEIAEVLSIPESTVKTTINRAIKKVRKSYEESIGGDAYEK
ncbi:RNA polymerase sigma factor SigX [Clostridium acetireducens DSM 10703]|jgi:RNA polymerase sigma-70 factor (ECF subfamily)|uniref:RNA polymerase sigma factor SigX n=1 Tax=Clostridium acetireducens DSM 10703 TaxID=1121290 RepID=A0A1E8EY00_9CLOT|nr:sigma-70 family RNA polymerase sigma factor [Clostridium acetireducens]OFI05821.1 RNA polymerase sigma factor SigX [Clostridium acetireducens DSM 10703]